MLRYNIFQRGGADLVSEHTHQQAALAGSDVVDSCSSKARSQEAVENRWCSAALDVTQYRGAQLVIESFFVFTEMRNQPLRIVFCAFRDNDQGMFFSAQDG